MRNKCFIGTIILSVLVLFGIWNHDSVARLVSGVVSHNHSSAQAGGGSLNLSGALSSSKLCEATYTRKLPNYCARDAGQGAAVTLTVNTCTAIAMPNGAVGLDLELFGRVNTNNAIAVRNATVAVYSENTCANLLGRVVIQAREEVAVLNQILADIRSRVTVFHSSPHVIYTQSGGTTAAGEYIIRGYYD